MARRSYLSRLAQPLTAADPAITSVPRAAAEDARAAVRAAAAPLAAPQPRAAQLRAPTLPSPARGTAAGADLTARSVGGDESADPIRFPRLDTAVPTGLVEPEPAHSAGRAGSSRTAAPQPLRERRVASAEGVAVSPPSIKTTVGSSSARKVFQQSSKSGVADAPFPAATSRAAAPDAGSPPRAHALTDRVNDVPAGHVAPPADRPREAPRAEPRRAPPSLSIGSIEVRVTQPPQPAPAPPPVAAPAFARAAPAPASAPIARAYLSRFGLAQG